MEVTKLRTNHIANPMGYALDGVSLSWVTKGSTGKMQKAAQVQVSLEETFDHILYDSGKAAASNSIDFPLSLALSPRTR